MNSLRWRRVAIVSVGINAVLLVVLVLAAAAGIRQAAEVMEVGESEWLLEGSFSLAQSADANDVHQALKNLAQPIPTDSTLRRELEQHRQAIVALAQARLQVLAPLSAAPQR